ncbi:unnamed protein product [Wickerhamomyces anomalus]
MSLHHDKGNFWTKVRSSTNKLSSSLANLSIRSEHDGDSPNSTLIHKALVNHYVSKNEQFPQWLGEEQENHQHHNHPQRAQPQNTAQEQIRQPVQTQRFQPQPQQQQQHNHNRELQVPHALPAGLPMIKIQEVQAGLLQVELIMEVTVVRGLQVQTQDQAIQREVIHQVVVQ